jgi:hypothetical protein
MACEKGFSLVDKEKLINDRQIIADLSNRLVK